jgi:hypothetical protein
MRFSSKLSLLFFLLCCALSLQAQVFSWREPGIRTCYKIDFVANHLYESNAKGQWQDLGVVNLVDVKAADLYTNADAINPIKLKGHKGTFLVMECSGQVYYFDLATKTIKREDLTFYRGANCQAVQFARKDTIYSFGGYGFWQSTNIMTQFNFVSKEWTHILANGPIPKAIHKKRAIYLPDEDRFIVLGSHRINQTESADVTEFDYSIYDYQFSDKKFNKLGEVYEPLLRTLMTGESSNFLLAMGRYIVISPNHNVPNYNHDLLYIIDVKDSFKAYLWTNPARFQIRKFIEERGVIYSVYANKNAIFLPQAQETYPYGSYQIAEVSINTLLAESKYLGPIMERPMFDTMQDFALIVFGVLVVFFVLRFLISLKRRKKRKQLRMLLGPNEKQFLDFLRLNYRQGYVSGHQIVAFFGKHKSSPESQRQFRAKLIDGLNKSLGLVFPGEQVLDIQADEKDQRMLTYRLTETIYQELKKL